MLPPNDIDAKNPNNTNSSYTTILPLPIAAEAAKYLIGLSGVQYTTT